MIEIEQFLISALFENPTAVIECDLVEEDFQTDLYGYVFKRMKELFDKKQTFSLADFAPELSADDINTIRDIMGEVASTTNGQIRDYANAISEEAEKLELLKVIYNITPMMSSTEIKSRLNSVSRAEKKQSLAKTGEQVLEGIKNSLNLPPECDKTGYGGLDRVMGGGLYKGFVYGFCGAEKSGKTTLAHSISYNLDKGGTKHMYVALEMGSQYIEQRNIARDLGINSLSFLNNREVVKSRIDTVKPRKNTIYLDAAGFTLSEIISETTKSMLRYGINGIILDYWQLVSATDGRQTEEKHLRDVAQKIADFAKRNNIWVIILAQMNADGKLFGGGGLKKACEQLYMIRTVEGNESMRWLEMEATRYTMRVDFGSDAVPSLEMENRAGPFFYEV